MDSFIPFSKASGIKCKKAPPISAPAEKPTNSMTILFNNFSLKANVTTPMKETKLTTKVAMTAQNNASCIPKSTCFFIYKTLEKRVKLINLLRIFESV